MLQAIEAAATSSYAGLLWPSDPSDAPKDAWGNLESGASEPGFSFTGREWDPEIGLYYYRARYYDPKVGRFIGEDPIGFGGGNNFYGYVNANPTNSRDPLGLYPDLYPLFEAWLNEPRPREQTWDEWYQDPNTTDAERVEADTIEPNPAADPTLMVGRAVVRSGASACRPTVPRTASQRGIDSLRQRIAEHERKLAEYLKDPDAFDNKGFLKNASPELRKKIIDARARHLRHEIETFKKNINKTVGH